MPDHRFDCHQKAPSQFSEVLLGAIPSRAVWVGAPTPSFAIDCPAAMTGAPSRGGVECVGLS